MLGGSELENETVIVKDVTRCAELGSPCRTHGGEIAWWRRGTRLWDLQLGRSLKLCRATQTGHSERARECCRGAMTVGAGASKDCVCCDKGVSDTQGRVPVTSVLLQDCLASSSLLNRFEGKYHGFKTGGSCAKCPVKQCFCVNGYNFRG